MMKIMIMNSILTTMMKHPLSMGFMLIMQTSMVSIYLTKISSSSWFSYILFITIIGGLMIMFMYMSSIASNEKFKMSTKKMIFMMIISTMIISIMSENSMQIMIKMMETKLNMTSKEELKFNTKMFNSNKMIITIMMMMMLFTMMVIVTKISSTFEGPLKKTYV